jgi:hypothetical protein
LKGTIYKYFDISAFLKPGLIRELAFSGSCIVCLFVCLMVFNATFNNISVISWRSVLLLEETGGPRENHRSVASH